MKIVIVAATGQNGELGYKNDLIWKIKEDMQFFKTITMNHYVLMGKNTYLSLPSLLKGRKHLVISTTLDSNEYIKVYKSVKDFLDDESLRNEEIFIIGGASIYKEFIDISDIMYLTEIQSEAIADAYFPVFSKDDFEIEVINEFLDNNPKYLRKKYIRK